MGDKKNDMDRIGLFQEMGYVTIGDKYKSAGQVAFNDASQKGKQMLPGGSKDRSALQAGYFTDKFGRVFESEGYSDPIKLRRQHRLREAQKNIVKSAFLPSSGEKKMSGLGSHYGTLSGPIGKRGTGFGYLGVTLGQYPKYQNEPYEVHKDITKKQCCYYWFSFLEFECEHHLLHIFSNKHAIIMAFIACLCSILVCQDCNTFKQASSIAILVQKFQNYVGITLGDYPKYQGDSYSRAREITKKELAAHKAALKGDSFKLNMHPKSYFDSNPYHTDKPMSRKGSASITKKLDGPKFKPSNPGKRPAGCKAGTFDPYPSHSADPYKMKIHRPVNVVNKSGKIFVPSQGPKTTPSVSIVDQNVMRTINIQNYRSVSSIV
ncbi:UPF0602 protein C4orf47,UPF0602 protein C4orf47 homolog [Mytilus edulis]|uniref:Cilia-and flagella-associated protein 96 n=1 Tax=Mytilus edulis TaxID=6550 RepID=A0A8S3RF57_MYTED|nr:UPF0602 protein C4orf47,UPF0602 protein C4orf47 homolog [Mytilus edulis]